MLLSKIATRTKQGHLLSCWNSGVVHHIRKKSTAAAAPYYQAAEVFPSIVIGAKGKIEPQGSFAEAQAEFLDPDPEAVQALRDGLLRTNMGVVAHYYMDVELQGVLHAVQRSHPDLAHRVGIADSLKMGDFAADMCKKTSSQIDAVACLGVDFMSESVSAILQKNGLGHVPVYRATSAPIGCSLAESAERDEYRAWLTKEGTGDQNGQEPLHVVYINTSLETKAVSTSIVPTITCTSSNVVQTMLQASAQVGPSLKILYGPDTYMGNNLVTFFQSLLKDRSWTDARIAQDLHPMHNRQSLQTLVDQINVFPSGNCVVHHMFGEDVVDSVRHHYQDAYVTAHLEVPGEMFAIAMEKSLEGKGVTGSTSDILNFISSKVKEAAATTFGTTQRLKFVLGTEAGMVTSIVKSVQEILEANPRAGHAIEAEIIFPVASDAIMAVDNKNDTSLAIVPGVAGGEGCSTAGGCATCPFMKMNDLDALLNVIDMVDANNKKSELTLQGHLPPNRLQGQKIGTQNALDLGIEPIMFMRDFMKHKSMPQELIQKIQGGEGAAQNSATML
mmetsp:Transcript_5341/g.7459  ORF Transcript_5341/g.7459 Transcript_5341/m.7459 type:complete len:558 (-) Transcript_5341:222-1895(-)|eukprot:CAMPEP_0194048526 /NCGR_PEP_ID=MMETSP0009_2-20130614/27576_1 /TAXON_ID=210454 /ORGANISM="Grammatophora oceanica, Strain CCMP 410" /LENGTH=557 /DNA_ID=CAMNT_0038694421 /DNA_START=154 /DNA_END=1827 /DNA_ORIENTATION=+